jgi:DnaJ-class molecular chaperone
MKWRPLNGKYQDRIEVLRAMPPHVLLDVAANATAEEIKRAYRRKVKTYHPDRIDSFLRPHGEEIMKLLNRAYQVLQTGLQR